MKECPQKDELKTLVQESYRMANMLVELKMKIDDHDSEIGRLRESHKAYLPSKVFWTILTIFIGITSAVMVFQLAIVSQVAAELKIMSGAITTELAEAKTNIDWIKRELEQAQITSE